MADEKKWDPADDSKVEGAIGVVKGRVEIHYPQPRLRVVFDSENARIFGEMMAKAAYITITMPQAFQNGSFPVTIEAL